MFTRGQEKSRGESISLALAVEQGGPVIRYERATLMRAKANTVDLSVRTSPLVCTGAAPARRRRRDVRCGPMPHPSWYGASPALQPSSPGAAAWMDTGKGRLSRQPRPLMGRTVRMVGS